MTTWRATQKANRRAELMASAARLFAERGFAAVSTADLGDAVGMSGPALYRHFASKEALLCAVLVDASERLLDGGRAIAGTVAEPRAAIEALIAFHLDFATTDADVIRVQDHELTRLPADVNQRVRSLQRAYVQEWDGRFALLRPDLDDAERQTRLLAAFGLLNSTPHSAAPTGDRAGGILAGMAQRALLES
ncbi:TetR/AcrR family transcriptional regulator [Microbacterium sp. 179-B 1A2 NHS]|uniref:TetR/AcrR family transcriptional regulator n=1 Tax=Microbacterium sp. 179-B 1A2 NHS TaxID=3142383 RepID=UPI00399F8939